MKHRATIILVALGLLLMSGGLLLVAYSDEESQSGDGESHSEGAPQNRDARPGSPLLAATVSEDEGVVLTAAVRERRRPRPGVRGGALVVMLAV